MRGLISITNEQLCFGGTIRSLTEEARRLIEAGELLECEGCDMKCPSIAAKTGSAYKETVTYRLKNSPCGRVE